MSFLKNFIYNKSIKRKEQDSLWVIHFRQNLILKSERTSAFTSKGSLTLEAALVVPIFFFAVLCLVSLLEMKVIQTTVKGALYSVAKEMGQQAYVSPILSIYGIEQDIVENIGADRLDRSMVVDGAKGIDCSGSISDWNNAEMDLSVEYQLEVPILMFQIPAVSCKETVKIKGWTGYTSASDESDERQVVYVAEHGSVYHSDMYCTFLNVSIRGIIASTIEDARNHSGGKYYACESCGSLEHIGIFYVSSYGDRYHTSLNCSKIKRNVYAMPIEDAAGLGGCSKCVK